MSSSSSIAPPCITFIGGGNMCEAILSGLLKTGHPLTHVRVSEPTPQRQEYLRSTYKIDVFGDNNQAITGASGQVSTAPVDVVVLAVKPQVVGEVVRGIAQSLQQTQPLVISIVAGVAIKDFSRWIHHQEKQQGSATGGKRVPLVRMMPNTPALVGEGAAGMFADADVSQEQRMQTEYVVRNIAKEYFWVDTESGVDAVCAVSGSGPAYFFLVIEAMEKAGIAMGLDAEVAKRLAAQTALGAAKMVLTSEDDVATLRTKVTSPNGTTQAAIEKMIEVGVPQGIAQGVAACRERCSTLSEEFGKL
ncbi:hypothetical protein LPJ66_000395 [Kickxella alabastrina]|uniref:Uncharacterized protein n=1 Tax=Kickxella alabastrina TaxID=61397 RepID=A0ACC1IW19_9FUNG|nr:hypothetical protein LPJ66_000395 [Kickxella alabastrina]